MREILRPKLLLFFAISIMSFYITSETTYAADASDTCSLKSYVEMGSQSLISIGSYCQQVCYSGYNYLYSLFVDKDDVKIQIRGSKKEVENVDDGSLCTDADFSDQDGDECKPGDMVCQYNNDYYENAFFLGKLVEDGAGSEKVDEFDTEFCGYTVAEEEILYEHTDGLNDIVDVSNEDDNAFDNLKQHYEAIGYEELV